MFETIRIGALALVLASGIPALAQTGPGTGTDAPQVGTPPAVTEPAPAQQQVPPPSDPAPAAVDSTQPAPAAPLATDVPAAQPDPAEPAAAFPAAPAPAGATEVSNPALPHDLSPWGMFMAADWVVKGVMIGLAFASLVTWTIWLAKALELRLAKRRARRAVAEVEAAPSLTALEAGARGALKRGPVAAILTAAQNELARSAGLADDGVKERAAMALSRIEARAGRNMAKGTGVLATIGSTAPFVGLFGTVWGIMNSFIGISQANTTNLAIVAPGIAEALLATAIGLVAAIPAVIIYNQFARSTAAYRALVADGSAAVLQHLSRELDRNKVVPVARPGFHAAAE